MTPQPTAEQIDTLRQEVLACLIVCDEVQGACDSLRDATAQQLAMLADADRELRELDDHPTRWEV